MLLLISVWGVASHGAADVCYANGDCAMKAVLVSRAHGIWNTLREGRVGFEKVCTKDMGLPKAWAGEPKRGSALFSLDFRACVIETASQ